MKIQIANNNQVEDFLLSNGAVIENFSGKTLEMKYPLKTERELRRFLEDKNSIRGQIEEIRQNLKFSKIICRFYFGEYMPSIELQKELIDFQKDIFDDITVQMINDNFDDFKVIYEYTRNNAEKPISTLIDSILATELLAQINGYIADTTPANTRWIYHKLNSYIDRLRIISNSMKRLGIDCYLTGCSKRYGEETEFRNIDVSTICKGYFGFKGCCLDYRPANKDKKGRKRGFALNMDGFEERSYEWETYKNSNYRNNRLMDFVKLDRVNPTRAEVSRRAGIMRLFQHLDTLNP